jgi:hypothetical protein
MSALKVYYVTLKKLADQGNAEAALALQIGENVGSEPDISSMTRGVCAHLARADSELGDALSYNDTKWTKATDRAIERARSAINSALSVIAQR